MSTTSKRPYRRFGITPEPENLVLGFLWKIIYLMGFVPSTFAKACGISQQLMHHYRTSDDCYLSTAQHMLSRVGISISPSLTSLKNKNRDSEEDEDRLRLLAKGPNYSIIGQIPTGKDRAPKYIRDSAASDSRLSFLSRALVKLSEREICTRTGLKRGKLIWIFRQDDIHISDLYRIASSMGLEVIWKASELDENHQ